MPQRETNYYTIELKNGSIAGYRARDVRLNGQPLTGIYALAGSGQLQFTAEPTKAGASRVFVGMIGKQLELTIGEAEKPGERRRVYGRVSSVTAGPAAANGAPTEHISFTYQKIEWQR
jgi:hypothetical protein